MISRESLAKTLDLSLGRLFEDYVGNILGIGTPGNRNFDLDQQSEIAALNQRKLTSGRIGADIADIKLNDGSAARKTLFKKAQKYRGNHQTSIILLTFLSGGVVGIPSPRHPPSVKTLKR